MGYIKANREQQFRPERLKYFSSFTDIFFQGSNRPQKSIARTERWNRFQRGGKKVLFLSDIKFPSSRPLNQKKNIFSPIFDVNCSVWETLVNLA